MHDLTTILSRCNSLTYPRDFINKLNAMIITSTFVSRSKTTAWPNAPRMDGRETTLKLSQSWRRRQDHLTDNNAVHITNNSLSYYIQRQRCTTPIIKHSDCSDIIDLYYCPFHHQKSAVFSVQTKQHKSITNILHATIATYIKVTLQ